MRLIDADRLKQAIQRHYPLNHGIINGGVDEMPTVGGWVSVKDRLPEAHKRVLVAADFSGIADVDVAIYCGDGMWESMSGLYPEAGRRTKKKAGNWKNSGADLSSVLPSLIPSLTNCTKTMLSGG